MLEGGGLVDVVRADDPLLFTAPVSLSFGDLDVNHGAQSRALAVQLDDAGGGAGTWSVELLPQSASAGATIEPDPQATIAPGGGDRLARDRSRRGRRGGRRQLRLHRAPARRRRPGASRTTSRSRGPASSSVRRSRCASSTRATRATASRTRACTASRRGRSARRPTTASARRWSQDGAEDLYIDPPRRARRELRRRGLGLGRERADRSVDPRLAGRERRAGPGCDADQHQQLHVRLPGGRRRSGRDVRAAEALLGLRRLRPRASSPGRRSTARTCCKSWVNDVYPPLDAARLGEGDRRDGR